MTGRRAAFAVPGDIKTLTGGYIYDRTLLEGLRATGREMALFELGTSFPAPTPADVEDAARRLAGLPRDCPVIFDGLAFGAMDHAALETIRAPIVAMIHHPLAFETGISAAERAHLLALERRNLRLAAHVLVPSLHTARLLVSDYDVAEERITIARPGTQRPGLQPTPTDPPLILSVGIQVPRKGHDVLLQALAEIRDRSWQAVIVGGVHHQAHADHLAELLRDLHLSDRVTLAGRVPQEALSAFYGQASLFALATRYEGYGIVFDEAMAHGLPIVTCDVGAVPDTVAPGAARLVPADDPAGFAAAMAEVLDDTGLRVGMAQASARAGAQLPSWDDTIALAGAVLDRVAEQGA